MLHLDTHILVFLLARDLRHASVRCWAANLATFPTVLWELAKLVELGRLRLNLRDRNVRHALGSLHVWPIDLVAETSTKLDFKGDPADELIAATSVVHYVRLLTRDRRIRRSKVVPLA